MITGAYRLAGDQRVRDVEYGVAMDVRPALAVLCGVALWLLPQGVMGTQEQPPNRPARQPDIFFVPTSEAVVDQMLSLARVTSNDIVYDLGSGDGRIVILAAQKYGARGVGIEIDPRLVATARQVAREGEVSHKVQFIEGDLFDADISSATVVTLYLSPSVNARLEPKLKKELRPGTRVVSHQFPIGRWPAEETLRGDDGTPLFRWTIGR